jgi:meromycolic acid enoyl-[acyl-carrier-protein] reductase
MLTMQGRRYLITGVLNSSSIAWSVSEKLQNLGCEIILTSTRRTRRITERYAARLPIMPDIVTLDAQNHEDYALVEEYVDSKWGYVDGVLHSIAYLSESALNGDFLAADSDAVIEGFLISSVSLQLLVANLYSMLARSPHGASVVALTIDTNRVLPGYGWMGVFKAALEAIGRYLAAECGQDDIRVNLVAAGPIATAAALGVNRIGPIISYYEGAAVLGWDSNNADPISDAVTFLFSDLSRHISGEILHCDGGAHAITGEVLSAAVEPPKSGG